MQLLHGQLFLAAVAIGAFSCGLAACRDHAVASQSADPTAKGAVVEASANRSSSIVTRRASFEVAKVKLTVEDIHMSTHFDDVLARDHAALVVNGGFFGEGDAPLGLAISNGKTTNAFAPQMSGGVLWTKNGIAHLTATEDFVADAPDFAVQCRPRLVVASHVNIKSDDGKRAARTALCLRSGGRMLDVVMALGERADDGPTLLELAKELEDTGCEEALNLDGGPSTGWASKGDGASVFVPPRAPVRQVIVIATAD